MQKAYQVFGDVPSSSESRAGLSRPPEASFFLLIKSARGNVFFSRGAGFLDEPDELERRVDGDDDVLFRRLRGGERLVE